MRFEYRLTGSGWSEATIEHDGVAADISASYLDDALGDLLAAVEALLAGNAESRASWAEEPGEFRWVLQRMGDQVTVRILTFGGLWSNEPDDRGEPIFTSRMALTDLATAVADEAQAVLDRYGMDGYHERWVEHPFPLERLRGIQATLLDRQPEPR